MTIPAEHKPYAAWFIPNPPREGFRVEVDSLPEALVLAHAIADYSLALGERRISVSAGGVEEWGGDDWYDLDEDDIDEEPGGIDLNGLVVAHAQRVREVLNDYGAYLRAEGI